YRSSLQRVVPALEAAAARSTGAGIRRHCKSPPAAPPPLVCSLRREIHHSRAAYSFFGGCRSRNDAGFAKSWRGNAGPGRPRRAAGSLLPGGCHPPQLGRRGHFHFRACHLPSPSAGPRLCRLTRLGIPSGLPIPHATLAHRMQKQRQPGLLVILAADLFFGLYPLARRPIPRAFSFRPGTVLRSFSAPTPAPCLPFVAAPRGPPS